MFRVLEGDRATRIVVDRDLDMVSSETLESTIDLAATSAKPVIVDLTRCGYCASSGLGVFIDANRRLSGRCIIVLPRSSHIRKVFEITKLVDILQICDTVTEALELLGRPGAV
jgi:anti-anti-sigma factor